MTREKQWRNCRGTGVRTVLPGKLNVKTRPQLGYISLFNILWFSIGCYFLRFSGCFPVILFFCIDVHIRIHYNISICFLVLATGLATVASGLHSTKFSPWIKPLVTPLVRLQLSLKLYQYIDPAENPFSTGGHKSYVAKFGCGATLLSWKRQNTITFSVDLDANEFHHKRGMSICLKTCIGMN